MIIAYIPRLESIYHGAHEKNHIVQIDNLFWKVIDKRNPTLQPLSADETI